MKGKARKPVVLFLHGLGGSMVDWDESTRLLEKSVDVLGLNLPGSAAGPFPEEGYDPVSLATWVSETLAKERVGAFRLIGHSLGARVAGEFAAREPKRVESLVLVSPLGAVPYGFAARLKWKAMSRRSILEGVSEDSMRSASGYGFASAGPGKEGFIRRALAARKGAGGRAAALGIEKSVDGILGAPPLAERLKKSSMPLLIVAGECDPLAPPSDSKALLKARPDAEYVVLRGIGHYPMLENAPLFVETIRDFLLA